LAARVPLAQALRKPSAHSRSVSRRTRRGTALRPTSSWCSPPGRKSCSSGSTLAVLRAPRLCDSHNPRPCRLDRAPRPQPGAQDKSESELPIAVEGSCIGITRAVDRCEHRRPRCRDRPSKRARPGGGTIASALPPAQVALSQCHVLRSLAARCRLLHRPGRASVPQLGTGLRPPHYCFAARPIPPVRSDSPASAVLVIPTLGIRMSRHANRSPVRRLAPADSSRLLCSSEMVDVGWCFATFAIAARC